MLRYSMYMLQDSQIVRNIPEIHPVFISTRAFNHSIGFLKIR